MAALVLAALAPPPTSVQAQGDSLAAAGARIWDARNCAGCHALGGAGAAGPGPDLTDVTQRRSGDRLRAWLRDPQAIEPGTKMPRYEWSAEELDAIIAHFDAVAAAQATALGRAASGEVRRGPWGVLAAAVVVLGVLLIVVWRRVARQRPESISDTPKGAGGLSGAAIWESRSWGAVVIGGYVVLVLLPLIVAVLVQAASGHVPPLSFRELGKGFALVGIALLAMQFVLSARLRWIERPFGLDVVFRYHKAAAVAAVALIALHPLLLALDGSRWRLLIGLDLPWYIVIAKLALLLLIVQAVTSVLRQGLRLRYERWRVLHNVAPVIFVIAFVHSMLAGEDLRGGIMRALWWVMLAGVAAAYGYHKVIAPALARRAAYRVSEVVRETHNVWTLRLEPPPGQPHFEFRPGQFHFITLWRGARNLPVEEHPFTICSSPVEPALASTIKESGDFTATIGRTEPGDAVSMRGPYGRFSYVLARQSDKFAFIAGGIGITPLMSMLRHMRDTEADVDVILLYGNRAEADIAFRKDLEQLAAGERPRLRVVHVLSEADASWQGERGLLDREKIRRLVGDRLSGSVCYVCGPPPMADRVIAALRDLGVPKGRIRHERFAL
ncbi:MAG: ferric reductase-like transmembrane domain-containing protein [Armatimonadota bacterium]|nr:MAG: ferric reductase-like transmembrane domain-containing protein [Armatimonadota bacterium]